MVNNVQPKYRNTLRGTYAGDQYDASGRQRGTWKACRYVRNARKGLRRLSGQTQKGYSEELPDDNADFTDRGGAFEAVRPNVNARALQV